MQHDCIRIRPIFEGIERSTRKRQKGNHRPAPRLRPAGTACAKATAGRQDPSFARMALQVRKQITSCSPALACRLHFDEGCNVSPFLSCATEKWQTSPDRQLPPPTVSCESANVVRPTHRGARPLKTPSHSRLGRSFLRLPPSGLFSTVISRIHDIGVALQVGLGDTCTNRKPSSRKTRRVK